MLRRFRPLSASLLPVSIASTVIGIVLIVIAELGDVHETRIFGAILITTGGLGIGTHTGLADPRQFRVPGWLADWRVAIAVIAALLAVGPTLVALVLLLGGLVGDADTDRSLWLLLLGALTGLVMAAATLWGTVVSIRRIRRAANEPAAAMTSDEVIEGDPA